ncbi:MAG TPA: hypothetical protein VF062_03280 [Candidatus Limnocylindrales bacterium]
MTEQVTPAAPAEPEKKGGGARRIVLSILGVIVALAVYGVIRYGISGLVDLVTGDTSTAKVGDCITETQDANDMKVVDCTTPEAAFKVVGVVDDKTQAEAEASCTTFATAESYLFRYEGNLTDATKGKVLCLEPNQK